MASSRTLAAEWASRACRTHAPEALRALGHEAVAEELGALRPLADLDACKQMSAAARRHKEAFPLDAEERDRALRDPQQAEGEPRAFACLHLVDVVAGTVGSYLFEEPLTDEQDTAVVRAWVADIARTLALFAGGEARADEEEARQRAEAAAS